jgi:hypothetical protein
MPRVTSILERAAKQAWLAGAYWYGHGRCSRCGRLHDDDGRPLLVARQPRRAARECLECWEHRQR